MKTSVTFITFMLLATLMLSGGCGSQSTIGTPAAADTPAVPLADVLASPADYNGKTVVLLGTLAAQCQALCDFTYKEKNQSVTIHMESGKKAPRMKSGSQLRVTASVLQGERQTVFTALGLERL
jgi:multidrug efflux pump subunit AcrA (membrane-fusion protein)